MLKTKNMFERLKASGFSDLQAEGLIVVIEELAEVFVTKDYLDARLAQQKEELKGHTNSVVRNWSLGIIGLLLAIVALILFQ